MMDGPAATWFHPFHLASPPTSLTGLLADLLTSQARDLSDLGTDRSLVLLSPDIHLAPSHASFGSLLKCHLLK